MVREIPLTQGKVALIDDEDFARVAQFKWCAVRMQRGGGRDHWYAKRGIVQDGKVINCYLHRFILGVPDAVRVDHEDGNGLNCQKGNMRHASPRQNSWNQRRPVNNTSGYKGIQQRATGWETKIVVHGKLMRLGIHPTAELAAAVYDAAARHYWGEFANTNLDTIVPEAVDRFRHWQDGERFSAPRHLRNNKLTDDDVRSIRRRYADGTATVKAMAVEYGVQPASLYHAINGHTFAHITDVPAMPNDKRKAA